MNTKLLLVILLLVTTILVLHSDEAVSQELTGDKGPGQKAALAKRLALVKKHFVNLDYKVDGQKRTAALFVPEKYDASKSWPLVVFLHGGGSGGDNNGNALTPWAARMPVASRLLKYPADYPALVLIPRCPKGKIWSPMPADPIQSEWRLRVHGRTPKPDAANHILAAIAATRSRYSVDKKRITLTGYSMGGEGSTRFAALHSDLFAAVAPMAGSAVIVLEDAPKLAKMKVWIFQGQKDKISTTPLARRTLSILILVTDLPVLLLIKIKLSIGLLSKSKFRKIAKQN